MGLFDWANPLERQLELGCVQMLLGVGMPNAEAQRMAKDVLRMAKHDAKKSNTLDLPLDYGDQLLANESANSALRESLARKRREGVTDADICLWWNRPDLERRVLDQMEELNRTALFMKLMREGKSGDQAGIEVRKYHAIYGDPVEDEVVKGDDRPLPYELMLRINEYVAKRKAAISGDIDRSSSFNALVREAMRAGRL